MDKASDRTDCAYSSTTVGTSSDVNTSTAADADAVLNGLLGLLTTTDSGRAVTNAVHVVLVGAEALHVGLLAAKLLCLGSAVHVV